MDCSPPGFSVYGISQGKNTGVGFHALVQGIFPTQGLNTSLLYLLHCRWILHCWVTREAIQSPIANVFVEHLVHASYSATLLSFLIPSSTRGPGSCSLFYKVNEERKAENGESPSWGHATSKWPSKVKSESESHSAVSGSLRPHGLYSPWNSPGQNTGVGSPSLLQGIFPSQRSNPGHHIASGFFTGWATREAQGGGHLGVTQLLQPSLGNHYTALSLESKWGWGWRGEPKVCPSQLSLQVPKGPPKNP